MIETAPGDQLTSSPPRRVREVFAFVVCALLLGYLSWHANTWQKQLWESTTPIRFAGDITNAYNQGKRANELGLLNVYDQVMAQARERPDGRPQFNLDYPPLRLTTAWAWQRWTEQTFPDAKTWQNTWEFNLPLLRMNAAFLALGTLGAAGVIWSLSAWREWQARGLALAIVAGLLVLYSPPANLIAFGWPQWDVCVPAFYLAALACGLRGSWLAAGVLLSIGAMFKGQLAVGIPILLIWPIVAGQFLGAVRLCVGLALGFGVIATPFLFRGVPNELIAFAAAMLLPWLIGLAYRASTGIRWWWWLVPQAIAIGISAYAGHKSAGLPGAVVGASFAIALMVFGQRLPLKLQPFAPAVGISAAIWTTAFATAASFAWMHVGFFFGTEHFTAMHMGQPSNLPAILARFYEVSRPDIIAFEMPSPFSDAVWEITWRGLLRTVFITGSVLSAIAMGIHHRRRNVKFAAAAVAPWLLFATFPAQIHERYISYPAIVSIIMLVMGWPWLFNYLALAIIATLPVLHGMLSAGRPAEWLKDYDPTLGPRLATYVQATHPGIGWALIALALTTLWVALDIRKPPTKSGPQLR